MNKQSLYAILLFLTIVVIIIYISNQKIKLEYFFDRNALVSNYDNNNHFIMDNNINYIETPLLNYKLNVEVKDNTGKMITKTKYLTVLHHQDFTTLYKGIGQSIKITDEPLQTDSQNSNKIDSKTLLELVKDNRAVTYLTSSQLKPVNYHMVWTSDLNSDGKLFTVWHPIAPEGNVVLGDIILMGTDRPTDDYVTCLPISALENIRVSNGILWQATNDLGKKCYCWGATNMDLFRCSNTYTDSMYELHDVYNVPKKFLEDNTILKNSYDIKKGIVI
jgi:hypothetical protein